MAAAHTWFTHGRFCDWKHASSRLFYHERSKDHLNAVVALARCAKEAGRMDFELAQQTEQAVKHWNRLVRVIKFACERSLALRGENEMLGSAANGNCLGTLELVAEYDDFLKQQI